MKLRLMLYRICRIVRLSCTSVRRTMPFKKAKMDNSVVSYSESVFNETDSKDFNAHSIQYLQNPVKPESDKKKYTVIQLPNGFTATIISDPQGLVDLKETDEYENVSESEVEESTGSESEGGAESFSGSDSEGGAKLGSEKLAACSLTVQAGSFNDPEEIQGLAHFLEHMIFMGSEKYPKENAFDSFIRNTGGSDNASTECEFTTYYFECQVQSLKKGLDMFSQLFIAPLMKKEAMSREREAIESEFQLAVGSDTYRKQQLLCSTANSKNPARLFSWGNEITLKEKVDDIDLYDSVHKFREIHYSADRMKLAIQARLPNEILEKWVIEYFSELERLPMQQPLVRCDIENPFDKDKFRQLYYVESIKDLNVLEVTWVLPSTLAQYKTKPLSYLSHLIGHEGQGSLISYLRKKLFALGLTAGHSDDGLSTNSIYTLFSIAIVLTETGRHHIEDIIVAIFSYIKMIQAEGPCERLFNEYKTLNEIDFKYSEESSAAVNVEHMSENMILYPPCHYLTGSELYFEYNPKEITDHLSRFLPNACNIMVSSKRPLSGIVCNKKEEWFGTKYTNTDIPEKWIEHCTNVKPYPEFHLPTKNVFIAEDFNLIQSKTAIPKYPKIIHTSDLLDVWYKADDKFKLPIATYNFQFACPNFRDTPMNSVHLSLFLKILGHLLIEDLYPASLGLLEYHFSHTDHGLEVSVYGFNHKLHLVLDRIAEGILNFNELFSEDLFKALKEVSAKSYYNDTLRVGALSRDVRLSVLVNKHYTLAEKYKCISEVTPESLKQFVEQMFQNIKVQALVQGNVTQDDAESVCQNFVEKLQCTPYLGKEIPIQLVTTIAPGEKACRIQSFNYNDQTCATVLYVQLGPGRIRDYVAVELLVMDMEEPMFDILRTKEQLGYDVSVEVKESFGIIGCTLTVNSQISKFTVDHVQNRIAEFLRTYREKLLTKTPEQFLETKQTLIKIKQCADTYLKEEVKRNWHEIRGFEYVFNRLEREIECINDLTHKEVISYFDTMMVLGGSKRLIVQIVGHLVNEFRGGDSNVLPKSIEYEYIVKDGDRPQEYFIQDLNSYKLGLPMYPQSKLTE